MASMRTKKRYLLLLVLWQLAVFFMLVAFPWKIIDDPFEVGANGLQVKSAVRENSTSMNHTLTEKPVIHMTSYPLPTDLDVTKVMKVKKELNFLKNYKNPCWFAQDHTLQCLPHFLSIGVGKCGTTNLFNLLKTHPQIIAPPSQETYWWQSEMYDGNQNLNINIYKRRFNNAANRISRYGETVNKSSYHPIITFDNSPNVLMAIIKGKNHLSSYEMKILIPQVKIIVMMREPTARLYSHYNYRRDVFPENNPEHFHHILINDMRTFNTCISKHTLKACAYDHRLYKLSLLYGMYDIFVKEWLQVFPREQFLFLRLEDFTTSETTQFEKLTTFLDIDKNKFSSPNMKTQQNKMAYPGPMLNKTKVLLENFHRPHIQRLARILNDTNFQWSDHLH